VVGVYAYRASEAGEQGVPVLCREDLEYLAFVVNSPSKIAELSVDPNEDFVQVPAPL
jgi:hypothetical protein